MGWNIIHPVLMPVPAPPTPPRQPQEAEKLAAQRAMARKALARSAEYSGVTLSSLEKDKNGAPRPSNGVFWSLSHTTEYVAAVTAPFPVGIDIERLRPFSSTLPEQIAGTNEWSLVPCVTTFLFYRYWTAKEAVLKAVGQGLAGLPDCTVEEIVDDKHMMLRYHSEMFTVFHYQAVADHICAITTNNYPIKWHTEEEAVSD